ncbi:MAG: hypothetical protein VR72_20160 [Clostridiaceae bacterium BRH_c20a]|nr:MAG: hypothetical protein VR72_20160 [Clostridiaceae bacterium BRH_c20a]
MEDKLALLKNKKIEYLKHIFELTSKQRQALVIEDIESFQLLINEKQLYMNKINQLDKELYQLEEGYQEEISESCRGILSTIIEADSENRIMATKIFEAIKEKIGKVRQGKKVHNAYNPSLFNTAFFNKAR